jgi:hypothetical protein
MYQAQQIQTLRIDNSLVRPQVSYLETIRQAAVLGTVVVLRRLINKESEIVIQPRPVCEVASAAPHCFLPYFPCTKG